VRIAVMEEVPSFGKAPSPKTQSMVSRSNTVSYKLTLSVEEENLFTKSNYSIGKSATEFFAKYPALESKGDFLKVHTYVIKDSLLSDKAQWTFWFHHGMFGRMEFGALVEKGSGNKSGKVIYPLVLQRTNALLAQGNQAFGQPDSLFNIMPKDYKEPELDKYYDNSLLFCHWTGAHEEVSFYVSESGTKSESHFWMAVYFDRPRE
jgi:hypothetical protein